MESEATFPLEADEHVHEVLVDVLRAAADLLVADALPLGDDLLEDAVHRREMARRLRFIPVTVARIPVHVGKRSGC